MYINFRPYYFCFAGLNNPSSDLDPSIPALSIESLAILSFLIIFSDNYGEMMQRFDLIPDIFKVFIGGCPVTAVK